MLLFVFFIVCIIFCLGFILFGVHNVNKINNLTKKCTLKITGQVIDYNIQQEYAEDSNPRSGRMHRHFYYVHTPIVKCYIDGNEVVKKLHSGEISSDTNPLYQIGEKIEIFVNPDDYNEFYTLKDKGLKSVGIIMICMGVFFLLLISIIFIPILFSHIMIIWATSHFS